MLNHTSSSADIEHPVPGSLGRRLRSQGVGWPRSEILLSPDLELKDKKGAAVTTAAPYPRNRAHHEERCPPIRKPAVP